MLTVWSGLAIGAIYVLVAIGFNIVFVTSGTFNFAQPQFLMVGTFISYAVVVTWGLPIVVAIALGAAAGLVLGGLEERLAVRPLARAGVHGELVTTVGWAVLMQGAVLLVWDSDAHRVPGLGSDHLVKILGGTVSVTDLVLIVSAVVLAIGLHVWLHTTRWGIACLATAEDRDAASLRGINTQRLSIGAFAVAGGLMAAMGAVAAPKTLAVFTLGTVLVLRAFVAMALGGFGNNIGALIGGLAVGLIESLTARYWGAHYVTPSVFVVLLAVLLLRPQGLFGRRAERVV